MRADPLEGYLREAASWDRDRAEQMLRSVRVAWRVAIGAGVCVLILAAALIVLMPLKRVEPYVIRVGRDGMVDVVPMYTGREHFGRAVSRYFLAHYISVCERFDYAMAQSDYQQCGAYNSTRLNELLYERWKRSNPRSPLNIHRDGSTAAVRIESVSFLQTGSRVADLAQVRFARITRQAGTQQRRTHWIASIRYEFTSASPDPRERRWNPLGFEVLSLELEREVLRPSPTTPGRE